MSRFLLGLALFSLLAYFLGGVFQQVSRSSRRPGPADRGEDLVQDPNCLTYLSRKDALETPRGGAVYYFCSPECAAAFDRQRTRG